ncbi:EF-hand domain-containing protein [Caballeronia sp. dw_19]|uniref:EF-hand domain-containing protein n=1 Tax=Caballeronia sp. dw_19 TaxID=2719791 RepID=UPI001BD3E275|nr:EF-hand domain-containing protein [Caballeronia sp. dw_19]
MTISNVGSDNTHFTQAGTTGQQEIAAAATNSSSAPNSGSGDSATTTNGDVTEASSTVTLSAGAQVIAGLNAQGISFAVSSLSIPVGMTDSAEIAKTVAEQARQNSTRPFDETSHKYVGAISQSGLETAVENFGGSHSSANILFTDLDTNGDGSVSDSELYTALGNTKSDPSSATSQALMHLMDTNDDGSVNMTEFANVEVALTNAEKSTSGN